MTDERLTHLGKITALLWPSPCVTSIGGPRPGPDDDVVAEFLLLPSRHRPRLVAPVERRAAAAVVRYHGEGRGPTSRLRATGLAWVLRSGTGTRLWRNRMVIRLPGGDRGETLVEHLAESLGRDVVIGMHLGPPRANRKPVLQLLSGDGRTIAYAKLGVDDLTSGLVGTEAEALATLAAAPTREIQVPTPLHSCRWRGHELLVQSALPVWSPRRPLTKERLVSAAAEIAAIGRLDGTPLAKSSFWSTLNARVAGLPAGSAAERVRDLLHRIDDVARDIPIDLGSSHGDWTAWNMACLADRLLVWDWERFRSEIPVGFDLLHHKLQSDITARRCQPSDAALDLVRGAADRLRPLNVPAAAAVLTALLYGADLATRYIADGQLEAGARLGDVEQWLLPALAGGLTRFEETAR